MANCELVGRWHIVLTDPSGQVKAERRGKNIITTNGKEFLASYLYSATTAATFTMKYVAIGTDATPEAAAQTALIAEAARHTGTVSYSSGAIYSVIATFGTGVGTGALVEYGLFSSNTNGTMLSRDTEAAINKGANDTLTVTTQITIS